MHRSMPIRDDHIYCLFFYTFLSFSIKCRSIANNKLEIIKNKTFSGLNYLHEL